MRMPLIHTFRLAAALLFLVVFISSFTSTDGFLLKPQCTFYPHQSSLEPALKGRFLDDLFGNPKQSKTETDQAEEPSSPAATENDNNKIDDDVDSLSLAAFQQEVTKRSSPQENEDDEDEEEFDGYVMRDIIIEKWGHAFDLEFQRVEALGFKEIYLNVMPFPLGSKRFRHASEMDYLCHLQAIVEILLKYNQVGNVLFQIDATTKKPRGGTSPLIAVPLKLDLTSEQVDKILGP